jgi:hypothetical protein
MACSTIIRRRLNARLPGVSREIPTDGVRGAASDNDLRWRHRGRGPPPSGAPASADRRQGYGRERDARAGRWRALLALVTGGKKSRHLARRLPALNGDETRYSDASLLARMTIPSV